MSYTLGVRIDIIPSAEQHGITHDEIRAVVSYPALRIALAPRIPNTTPVLHIGPTAANEPWIEVIADNVTPTELIIFHAMMLRPMRFPRDRGGISYKE